MVNPPKIKGTRAETAVIAYLRIRGAVNAERRALNGGKDRGDVTGIPGVCIEVKDERKVDLAGWLTEALVEQRNSGAAVGFAWAKRRGKGSPGEWYVVMTGEQAVSLLQQSGFMP